MAPRTRVAPSPTGYCHIGDLRVEISSETIGLDLPETLVLLGRDKVLERFEAAMKLA